jgi:ribonuclease P protein component
LIDRIHERAVFRSFGQDAARARSGPLTVLRASSPVRDRPAVAYAIPRKVGGAVVRNRLRRQLRHASAELDQLGRFAPRAHLVIVRPEAAGASMTTLRASLERALERLGELSTSPTASASPMNSISGTDSLALEDRST